MWNLNIFMDFWTFLRKYWGFLKGFRGILRGFWGNLKGLSVNGKFEHFEGFLRDFCRILDKCGIWTFLRDFWGILLGILKDFWGITAGFSINLEFDHLKGFLRDFWGTFEGFSVNVKFVHFLMNFEGFLREFWVINERINQWRISNVVAEQLIKWENTLLRIQQTIEEWQQVQSQWLYLDPIFSSPNIIDQMPSEATLFQVILLHHLIIIN